MKRGLYAALLLSGLAGVLLLASASGTWAHALVPGVAPLPDRTVDVHGRDLVEGLRAVGLLALAGVPALLAARRWGRVAVGVLLLAGGVLVALLTARVLVDLDARALGSAVYRAAAGLQDGADVYGDGLVQRTATPGLALLGGVLFALAGLVTVLRGRSWAALGARYEAPAARPAAPEQTDKGTWDALDRGLDPTADPER